MSNFPFELPFEAVLSFRGGEATAFVSPGQPDAERFPDAEIEGVAVAEVRVMDRGAELALGSFYFWNGSGGSFEDIWVSPAHRRKGIATAVYDLLESMGMSVEPSSEMDEDGSLFWAARTEARSITPA